MDVASIARKLKRAYRRHGILETVKLAWVNVTNPSAGGEGSKPNRGPDAFDLEYGVETAPVIEAGSLDLSGDSADFAHRYQPCSPEFFHKLMGELGPMMRFEDKAFIDIGCGMGRPVLLASLYPFKKVRGVELSPSLTERAKENIVAFNGEKKCQDVEVSCGDALKYEFPAGPMLVFLYNSFMEPITRAFLEHLAANVRNEPREVWLAYVDPKHPETVSRTGVFEAVIERPNVAVYRSRV